MLRNIRLDHLSVCQSVCLSVSLSVRKLTVAKRLSGSGCHWDGKWGRSRDGYIRWGGDRRREGSSFEVNLGVPL